MKGNVIYAKFSTRKNDGARQVVYGPNKIMNPKSVPAKNGKWIGNPHGHVVRKQGRKVYHRTVGGRVLVDKK